ncbi:EF_hand_5 domain-containing protein [Cephalotus follicularis]|uniref:EF_hand_5 domain-containing protein n=1 Tax=Cephalotus follicularis TaxID=3775 RepID=A0A1Q3B181_CEPFO|nr:EF_hand_5 domain-containing protein [Cephalotus follicularis]
MSLIQSYYSVTMDKTSKTNQLSSPFLDDLFTNMVFFDWVSSIPKVCSRYWSVLHTQFHCYDLKLKDETDSRLEFSNCVNEKKDDANLYRHEVEMLMGKLGLFCSPESEELPQFLGSNELSGLFEEKEPSLEEVKEAFDVFDENRDGFIDARELQRVLCILGCKEGSVLENCNRMIKTFDQNGDGRIGFNEFVKLMENSFC